MPNNPIINAKFIAPGTKQFIIKAPLIASKRKAGQFAILQISEQGERVPMTIVDSDSSSGTISLIVQGIGKTTIEMNKINTGDQIHYLVGPLGTPSRIEHFGNVVVIGGGVGTAVSFPQVQALKEAGNCVTAIIGARTRSMVILEKEIRQIGDAFSVCKNRGTSDTGSATVISAMGAGRLAARSINAYLKSKPIAEKV